MRDVDQLIESAMDVIHRGRVSAGGGIIAPLLSGGHDSLVACHLASQHPNFTRDVHHINTGIGSKYTLGFVHSVCEKFGWRLTVHKSRSTYEEYVRTQGFPGPGRHQFVYNRIKDRCVREIAKGRLRRVLITGCRSQESVRRMGHVAPVQIGETSKKTGITRNANRIWTAPCHDWSKAEQQLYMDEFGLPVNRMKVAIGFSGECFCGSYAAPGEIELVKEHAPDVATEIDRLTVIAAECGKHCIWGTRPVKESGTRIITASGPLCSSCDYRQAAAGIQIVSR